MSQTKFTLADLRACWGNLPPATRKAKRKGPRKFPLDFGPGSCNLLDVREWPQGPGYRRQAARDVTQLHAFFRSRGERVRICKRRHLDEYRYAGRPFIQIVVVAA